MGYIKEPKGVDLIVAPSIFTEEDRRMISEIIADYKRTGKMPRKTGAGIRGRKTKGRPFRKRILH